MSNGTFLYPNVTSIPGQSGVSPLEPKKQNGIDGEFDQIFEKTLNETKSEKNLNDIKAPLKFSAHASQRLKDRKIVMDAATMSKVNDAVDKAEAKGIEDTLVLTQDAALIINVKNRTVITAMEKNAISGNVFTNIDGAVVV